MISVKVILPWIRLKYAVAFVVVLLGYHRLNDAEFIIRSFHFHAHNEPERMSYTAESSLDIEIRGVTDTTTRDLYELYLSLNATGKKGWPEDDIIDTEDTSSGGGLCPICSSILRFFLSDKDPANEETTPAAEPTGNYSAATQDLYDLYLSLGEKSQKHRPLPGGKVESLDKTQRHRRLSNNSVNKVGTKHIVKVESQKIDTSSGNFCPICSYNGGVLCENRVKNVMKQRGSTMEEAIKSSMDRCTSPPIQHKIYNEEDEPHIVFHVGPHKTGTTALQAFIYDLIYVNGTIFPRDNYRVPSYEELPGVFAKEGVGLNLPHCSLENYKRSGGQENEGMCERMRKAFPKFALDAYNKAQNLLIVAEDFDRKEINFNRLRFFLRPYKKVKVVTTYRRLHDWLPSWYNQIMVHYNIKYAHGEEKYPSFVEWLNANYDEFVLAHSIEVANRFRKYDFVESIDMVNMHDVSNLIEHFFCDHLQAKSVCHAAKEGFVPSKSNIGTDHDYERLAIKASLEGKISYKLHKPLHINRAPRHLRNKIEEANLQDKLPMICPPKALLDKIYETELEHDNTYFPKWFEQQGGKDGLRKSFDDAVKKKFCSFNAEKIFKTGILDSIFKEINPNVAPAK